jgi:hypothetical protein
MTQACEISRYIHEKTDTTKGKNAKVCTQPRNLQYQSVFIEPKKRGPSLILQDTPIIRRKAKKKKAIYEESEECSPKKNKIIERKHVKKSGKLPRNVPRRCTVVHGR